MPNDKPYDPVLAKKYDGPAKRAWMEWANQLGMLDIRINEAESRGDFTKGVFDIDATTPFGDHCKFDVETKEDWGTIWTKFPFKTFDVPYRKRKARVATHHMLFGGRYDLAGIIRRADVEAALVEPKPCRNRNGEMEEFYRVPTRLVYLWKKVNGLWMQGGTELLERVLR